MKSDAAILDCPPQGSERLAAALADCVSGETVIQRDEPLARHTTLRVGGPADVLVEPASERDLAAVLRFCAARGVEWLLLGRGSNLLVRDGGFRGVVIRLAHPHFSRIEVNGCRLRCGAGAKLKHVVAEARRQAIGGLDFLEGIPGTVGGALRMNAGAMGRALVDVLETVRFMDLEANIEERRAADVGAQYRRCVFLERRVALSAVLAGVPADRQDIEQKLTAFSRKRRETQPAAPSAGCIFKNPSLLPAGRLIDELGLKGARVGGAVVSQEHANFIVTERGATAGEVLELIARIQQKARAERGIELETEVQIVGG